MLVEPETKYVRERCIRVAAIAIVVQVGMNIYMELSKKPGASGEKIKHAMLNSANVPRMMTFNRHSA
jgi:hypothetical protein